MESITAFAPEIQKRISGFARFLSSESFSRPEVKNISSLLSAMLKKHDVHVSELARSLGEKISPKKTEERLHRNLRREGLGRRLLAANALKNRTAIRAKRYCIIDLSDIQKPYATKMEGLGRVRDGDKSQRGAAEIGNGLYWINAVMADVSGILPVSSEIYGLDYEGRDHTSENSKILSIIDLVHALHADAIHVIDRGGDRTVIIGSLIAGGREFVIRGQAQRSLRLHQDSAKATNIKKIAQRTRTDHAYKSLRNGVWFDVGIRRVYWGETPLWLVVSRSRQGGLSWYLTNVEGKRNKVMDTVLEAYGLRWRVEEYHRQIKQDYSLEKICLRNYNAIKNMGALVMLAASLLACLPKSLFTQMLALSNMLPRKRISDIPDYPYYMITAAVSWILGQTQTRRHKPLWVRKRDYCQLNLDLRGF